jgi:hyperosmotically inducible periplasmic protein
MRLFRLFFILSVAILGVSSINVSAQSNAFGQNSTQGIERKVRKEIMTQPYYGLFDAISFKLEGGTVYLFGSVVRPTTKSGAERSIKRITGVTNVVNNIEVLPLSNFDDQIRLAVAREIANRGGSLYRYLQGVNPSMRIIVKNGNVSLEGYVANRADANLARILASSVFGVFSVNNNLIAENETDR